MIEPHPGKFAPAHRRDKKNCLVFCWDRHCVQDFRTRSVGPEAATVTSSCEACPSSSGDFTYFAFLFLFHHDFLALAIKLFTTFVLAVNSLIRHRLSSQSFDSPKT